ncbi:MAG TPA: hypothetical protein VGL60_12915 [Acidimicrobiales bacterium]|jgi:hypothetical protein
MANDFDPDAMIARFRERAAAVRRRGLPPVEGPERQRLREQAQLDFMDFAMLGDAVAALDEGILTLRVDLRPPQASGDPASGDPVS